MYCNICQFKSLIATHYMVQLSNAHLIVCNPTFSRAVPLSTWLALKPNTFKMKPLSHADFVVALNHSPFIFTVTPTVGFNTRRFRWGWKLVWWWIQPYFAREEQWEQNLDKKLSSAGFITSPNRTRSGKMRSMWIPFGVQQTKSLNHKHQCSNVRTPLA